MQQANLRTMRRTTLSSSMAAEREALTGELAMDRQTEAICEESEIAISSSSEEEDR